MDDESLQEPSLTKPIGSPTEQQATSDAGGELESEQDDSALEGLLPVADAPVSVCSCPCCTNYDVAHQPMDLGEI